MYTEPWETLKISRATYYRHLKASKHLSLIKDFNTYLSQAVYGIQLSHRYQTQTINQIKAYLKVYPLVSPEGLAHWISEIPVERFATRKNRHAAISNFSKYLNTIKELSDEDYQRIRNLYPRKSKYIRPVQKIIYEDDLDRILKETSQDKILHHSIIILSETALRLAEYCNLKRTDMRFSPDPTQAILNVRFGKGGKERWVPFSRRAQESMRIIIEERGEFKVSYRGLIDKIKLVSEELSIPFKAHSLRHYRITKWANNPRISIVTTQKWAGHETLTVTQGYIHMRDVDAMRAAYE